METHSSVETVAELIERHGAAIAELRKACADVLDPAQHDDLWILRYVLSNRDDLKKAEKAIRSTIAWRKENAEMLAAVGCGSRKAPHDPLMSLFMIGSLHKQAKNGSPLLVGRAGISNPSMLMDFLAKKGKKDDKNELLQWQIFQKEQAYVICDRETRRTGRLVKLVTIADWNHGSFLSCSDRRFFSVISKAMKVTEDFYPQLLGMTVLVNMPSWFNMLYNIVKYLLPKKTVAKARFCAGKTLKQALSDCPYSRIMLSPENIPTFLGGTCECKEFGGCCGGIPNSQTTQVCPSMQVIMEAASRE